jgi:hypothetical protein
MGMDVAVGDDLASRLLAGTAEPPVAGSHVFTLHAELEGLRLAPVLERLIEGWKDQGYDVGPVRALYDAVEPMALPRCDAVIGTVPGRTGTLLTQGGEFLAEMDYGEAA